MPTEKFDYLILLNAPFQRYGDNSTQVARAMSIASDALGISAWTAPVEFGNEDSLKHVPPLERMFFRLEKSASNDTRAQGIAEAVILTAELDLGPLRTLGEEEIAIRLRRPRPFRRNAYSCTNRIIAAVADPMAYGLHYKHDINTCSFMAPEAFAAGWAFASTVLRNPKLHDALAFHSMSVRRFFTSPSQLEEAELNNTKIGANRSALAASEGAFQDAYKAIEAIIGQPPGDDKKLISKLLGAGCDPYADVGFDEELTRWEAIRRVEEIRNSRAAHGGSPNRGLAVLEVVACQIWAKEIIRAHIDHLEGAKSVEQWFKRNADPIHRKT
jgi:hypothetical protein